jgi:hypothetical protein
MFQFVLHPFLADSIYSTLHQFLSDHKVHSISAHNRRNTAKVGDENFGEYRFSCYLHHWSNYAVEVVGDDVCIVG